MSANPKPLLIAVSSRALFALEAENQTFDKDDDAPYMIDPAWAVLAHFGGYPDPRR
jgi:hypothetical protein